jgi:hypothetical protein
MRKTATFETQLRSRRREFGVSAVVVWANNYNKFDPTSPFGGHEEGGSSTRKTALASAKPLAQPRSVVKAACRGWQRIAGSNDYFNAKKLSRFYELSLLKLR